MGRPTLKAERRGELVEAYARVLADAGHAGATVHRIAEAAGLAPGLVHHYFRSRAELDVTLFDRLVDVFRRRTAVVDDPDALGSYIDAALALGRTADRVAARAWVGVLAHALADAGLFERTRAMLDAEVDRIDRRSDHRLGAAGASALLAFILGSLVFGAFAPRRVAGFAAPAARRFAHALMR